jgi:signal transduction histidine kinase
VRVLLAEFAPQFAIHGPMLLAMGAGILVTNLLAALFLLRVTVTPLWARQRFACGIALLAASRAITYPTPNGDPSDTLAILMNLSGVVLVLGTSLALIRVTLGEHRQWLASLHDQLAHMEAGLRIDRARLHEVGSTIAGIASASRLVHDLEHVSPTQRRRLERTIDSEMARLERLMSTRVGGALCPVDIDETLEPVVVAHQARGHKLVWEPSGLWVRGRADDLAEVVNILLENAAQHARGTMTWVMVRRVNETVEISVCDSGPGFPEHVQRRLFEWGARGGGSSGQGIGLHVAHRLVTDQGGSLTVAEGRAQGACLVVTLPENPPLE